MTPNILCNARTKEFFCNIYVEQKMEKW